MKYAVFNADGILETCLLEGIHCIPKSAIKIDARLFLRITQETDGIWQLVDGEVVKQPLPVIAPDYAQIIASARYEREIAGVTVQGLAIATDRNTRATISDKALGAMIDPASVCNLKTAAGFVELAAPQILAISSAIRSYVQACFDREEALLALVEVGTYTDDMRAAGWPSTIIDPVEGGKA